MNKLTVIQNDKNFDTEIILNGIPLKGVTGYKLIAAHDEYASITVTLDVQLTDPEHNE